MQAKSVLPPHWQVPGIFRQRLGERSGRQRVMAAEGHLLLVLHKPPAPGELERTGRFFWRHPDGSWTSDQLGSGIQSLQKHLEEYADLLEAAEKKSATAGQAQDHFALLRVLGPLHRAAAHMRAALQQARDLVEDREIINARDRSEEIERGLEILHGDTRNALEFAIASQAEEQARSSHAMAVSSHRLNMLAAFFFPLATLSTIFGMNLSHGIEQISPPLPFLAVLGAGLFLGLWLVMIVSLRRERPV